MKTKLYFVRYEVRSLNAIGVFWSKEDYVYANTPEEAGERFRERWQHKYEFRFPILITEEN